jgi:cytochrome P450
LKAIRDRRASPTTRPDSLNRYLKAIEDEKVKDMDDMELASNMIMQLIVGTDTTAVACAWTIYLLHQHPDIHQRLLKELRELIPDINAEINHAIVRDHPYFNAVLNESLRLYPVAAGDPHRVVPKEGYEFQGHFLPGGTVVMANQYMFNRWDRIWDEPDKFKPERWLTNDAEKLQEMKRSFHPFSIGARSCIGRE